MIPSLDDVRLAGRRVLVRADLNVPLRDGTVADATRIERFAPTARRLLDAGAAVTVMSHLGRPKRGPGGPESGLSLRPVAEALAGILECPVQFVPDCIGEAALARTAALGPGECALLENLRFHAGEEADDPEFAASLARHGDLFVNDAFSCSHRAHASIHAIAGRMESCAGMSLLAEVEALSGVLEKPARPTAALIGGAKISSKIAVLENIAGRMDAMFIGGAMANTFLAADGIPVGASLQEPGEQETARRIASRCREAGCELLLPCDAVVAERLAGGVPCQTVPVGAVPQEMMILDVGPATARQFCSRLNSLKTLLWNGPLGAFEMDPFGSGTNAVARCAAERTRTGQLTTVAGGGDTVSALRAAGVADRFSYVSTAGGAFLEWIEGRRLPGIAALERMAGSGS